MALVLQPGETAAKCRKLSVRMDETTGYFESLGHFPANFVATTPGIFSPKTPSFPNVYQVVYHNI